MIGPHMALLSDMRDALLGRTILKVTPNQHCGGRYYEAVTFHLDNGAVVQLAMATMDDTQEPPCDEKLPLSGWRSVSPLAGLDELMGDPSDPGVT